MDNEGIINNIKSIYIIKNIFNYVLYLVLSMGYFFICVIKSI